MSLKDLCTIEMIPDLIDAGIDSFKIEGRMKQPEYVFVVVQTVSEVCGRVSCKWKREVPGYAK